MRQSSSHDGFVLAESIISLAIVSIAVVTLALTMQGLDQQQQRRQIELTAARLAKEATDQQWVTGKSICRRHGNFVVSASREEVQVCWQGQQVLRVQG